MRAVYRCDATPRIASQRLAIGGRTCRHACDIVVYETLYGEVRELNRPLVRSSIVAVTTEDRPNQYLLYHDDGWECDFIPNRRSSDDYETDTTNMAEYMKREYMVPVKPSGLRLVGTSTNSKLSTEHNEVRDYEYRLYLLRLHETPEPWAGERFRILDKDCCMMSIGDMLSGSRMNSVNHDVIAMVRDMA